MLRDIGSWKWKKTGCKQLHNLYVNNLNVTNPFEVQQNDIQRKRRCQKSRNMKEIIVRTCVIDNIRSDCSDKMRSIEPLIQMIAVHIIKESLKGICWAVLFYAWFKAKHITIWKINTISKTVWSKAMNNKYPWQALFKSWWK